MSLVEYPLIERIRYPEIDTPSDVASTSEEMGIRKPTEATIVDDTLFVAVGNVFKESKSTVLYALQNSRGRKICILHVHLPSQKISILGGRFHISPLGKQDVMVMAQHEKERQEVFKVLDQYDHLCAEAGVQAQRLYIEGDSIENGIVTLISQNKIGCLVMGAAADRKHSRLTKERMSKKANHVLLQAPEFCHIWFVCQGQLIFERRDIKPQNENLGSGGSNSLQSSSTKMTQENQSSAAGVTTKTMDYDGWSTLRTSFDSKGSSDESDQMSISISLPDSSSPSSSAVQPENDVRPNPLPHALGNRPDFSSSATVLETNMNDVLYDQLQLAMTEAENLRQETYKESLKRSKAERDTLEAIRKAKAAEILYSEELVRRKELELKLFNTSKDVETKKIQQNNVLEELQVALSQKSSLENEIEKSKFIVVELEDKIVSAVNLLQKYKKERDDLQVERNSALREAEGLRKQLSAPHFTKTDASLFYAEFCYDEILAATDNLSSSMKIAEGGYGSIYRAFLRYTEVAIKVLDPGGLQGPHEFQQEVNILSKLRHPHIVTLIGICKEAWALIYEYLPSGNLEQRLSCQDNTPPLSWQNRIQIAAELCSVLIFLHSCDPQNIIHGDLKPENVLLDAHLSCKLSDFGISREISKRELSEESKTRFCKTSLKGTFAYMDPEFLSTGELTAKSDVYSYGIILLRLLTGKEALGIIREVQSALDSEKLDAILDPSAGDWPFVQAKQLACLALRCCAMSRKDRPDLVSDIWRVIEPMRASCGSSTSLRDDDDHAPPYFICPIFQEVMEDPHIAADGFTYEAEAIKGWIESGHDTSPMTNLQLPNHNLISNRALRSAIQEWLQHRRKA